VPKIVLIDTNVWVSAFINRKGYPARVKEKFLKQEFEVIISTSLLKELSYVLFIEILAGTCRKVYLTNDINVCRDHKDNMVLETAIKGGAGYLVSRDDDIKKDSRLIEEMKKYGINIVSVSRFLEVLSGLQY